MVGPDVCGFGTVRSRASVSMTTPFASRIFMSTRTAPIGASNAAWFRTPDDTDSPVGPTGPSNSTVPSGADAVTTTVAARGLGVAEVIADTHVDGAHVTMTTARPASAGVIPDHDWISELRRSTRTGALAGGASSARITADIGATYPVRART